MKVQINAASDWDFNKNIIIEANSIDEAIKRIQEDKNLVLSVVNKDSWLYDKEHDNYLTPTCFIVNTNKTEEYDVEIELYDDYLE